MSYRAECWGVCVGGGRSKENVTVENPKRQIEAELCMSPPSPTLHRSSVLNFRSTRESMTKGVLPQARVWRGGQGRSAAGLIQGSHYWYADQSGNCVSLSLYSCGRT